MIFVQVLICVASDILAIGMDHYFDQAPMLSYALKTGNSEMTAIFKQAKVLLFSNVPFSSLPLPSLRHGHGRW